MNWTNIWLPNPLVWVTYWKGESILDKARMALTCASSKWDQIVFYWNSLKEDKAKNVELIMLTSQILASWDLETHFQLKLDINNTIQWYEILIRLPNYKGQIYLDQFLNCVKKLWKSRTLTRLVIEKSLAQIKWNKKISINIELFEIDNSSWQDLIDFVNQKLNFYWLTPEQVTFEALESWSYTKKSFENMVNFHNKTWCKFRIDDILSGSSNLDWLIWIEKYMRKNNVCKENLPIKWIKIDLNAVQESISNKTAYDFIKTIVKSAHGMWIEVVAEGVEWVGDFTDNQMWTHLCNLWIYIFQWYSIHKPSADLLSDEKIEKLKQKLLCCESKCCSSSN